MSQMSNEYKCQMSTNVKWVQMSNEYKCQMSTNVKWVQMSNDKWKISQMANESNVKWVKC